MNNLLRIFLIFNLFSSATSSVNNYSVPLPETELKMGQNSSELVEREEPKILIGGTIVQGVWINSGGSSLQRPCALSFPVKKYGRYKGFLTSLSCSNTNFFVKDIPDKEIEVGEVGAPTVFAPERGLDYTFVDVYPEHWSDKDSKSVLYSYCDGSYNMPLPISSVPIQPPLNFTVCAFGGLNGGLGERMECGKILEFDATIQVPVPGSDGEKFVDFAKVVKVNMTNDYDLGYMGAPVYVYLPAPNSDQIVAVPVGQIVETLAQYKNEENQDKKIWYYIPLDRILKDGGLELLSSMANPSSVAESNNTEFSDVSFSNSSTISSNTSEVAFPDQPQPQPQTLIVLGGRPILISSRSDQFVAGAKKYTISFAIKRTFPFGRPERGFLLLGSSLTSQVDINGGYSDALGGEPVHLGYIPFLDSSGYYQPPLGLNFAFLILDPNSDRLKLWDDELSTQIPVPGGFANVVAGDGLDRFFSPRKGDEVCFRGGYSGHVCGIVTESSIALMRWRVWGGLEGFIPDVFTSLIRARLGPLTRAQREDKEHEDWGSPVYVPSHNANGRITKVRPAGILFTYEINYENNEGRCEMASYIYFISMANILFYNGNLDLIPTPQQ